MLAGAAVLAGGCGGDDGGGATAGNAGGGGGEDAAAIEAVTVRALTSRDPKVRCTQVVTDAFVRVVYGDLATCTKAETPEKDDRPPTGATVKDVRVDGARATATVTAQGGDSDGATGQLTYAEVGGAWRVDELGVAFLRSQLTASLRNADFTKGDGPLTDPKARTCIESDLQKLDDARFRRLAYDAIADRDPDPNFLEVVTRCASQSDGKGGSLLRRQFESGIRESLKGDGANETQVACVIEKLRETISEDEIVAQVKAGADNASPELTGKAAEAIRACG